MYTFFLTCNKKKLFLIFFILSPHLPDLTSSASRRPLASSMKANTITIIAAPGSSGR